MVAARAGFLQKKPWEFAQGALISYISGKSLEFWITPGEGSSRDVSLHWSPDGLEETSGD